MLRGLEEPLARFYVGSIVLALEYLHLNSIGGWVRGWVGHAVGLWVGGQQCVVGAQV